MAVIDNRNVPVIGTCRLNCLADLRLLFVVKLVSQVRSAEAS